MQSKEERGWQNEISLEGISISSKRGKRESVEGWGRKPGEKLQEESRRKRQLWAGRGNFKRELRAGATGLQVGAQGQRTGSHGQGRVKGAAGLQAAPKRRGRGLQYCRRELREVRVAKRHRSQELWDCRQFLRGHK